MAESQQTDCLAVGAELKRNADVQKIAKEGCIDTTGGVEKKVHHVLPVACNLIRDTTKGPMCGGMLGEFGKTIEIPASPKPGEKSNLSIVGRYRDLMRFKNFRLRCPLGCFFLFLCV